MGGPNKDKTLHANRQYSTPWDGFGPRNCFSRQDILTGKIPTAFADGQSMSICPDGEHDPSTFPDMWYTQGKVLRVPQVVILSSLPFWTVWWKSCYFYGPRAILNSDSQGNLGNYYYFDQYNDVDPDTQTPPDYSSQSPPGTPGYDNNSFWNNFTNLTTNDKYTVYNQQQTDISSGLPNGSATPSYLINGCSTPPSTRYSRIICTVTNPYYALHQQITRAFLQAKTTLEGLGYHVIVPEWMPQKLYQLRNAYLKQTAEIVNGARQNGNCVADDSTPCYFYNPVCWGPAYPNINDPRNNPGFDTPGVPWLSSLEPGFGTNVLHLYVGHPCVKFTTSQSIWDFQAWPLSPEAIYFGPVDQTYYLGSDLPFYAGRRAIWRDYGYSYGYTSGVQGIYNYYQSPISSAVSTYQQNFLKFRNITTKLFTYPATWNFAWNLEDIRRDQENNCPSTQFYDGYTYGEYINLNAQPDTYFVDCQNYAVGEVHLPYAEKYQAFPSTISINQALTVFYPPIQQRIMNYYKGIEPGAAQFYQLAIDSNNLSQYNVSYEGAFPGALMSGDGIVSYVQDYFKSHP